MDKSITKLALVPITLYYKIPRRVCGLLWVLWRHSRFDKGDWHKPLAPITRKAWASDHISLGALKGPFPSGR